VHSAVAQADGNRAADLPVRRAEIETIHPIVRVHPTTGWKSVYVNPGEHVFSFWESFFLFKYPDWLTHDVLSRFHATYRWCAQG
jgi:hypothetical protein